MQSLPLRLDLFTLLMLLGVAQGGLLSVFFLTGTRSRYWANRCLGVFMLALTAISAEILLCYSNYMFRTLVVIDFSEPFNFLLGPLLWGFVFARLHGRLPRRWGWHLLPAAIWTVNATTWLFQPIEFKYNSYISAFHPELPFVATSLRYEDDFTGLRHLVSELTLVSCLIYAILSLLAVRRAYGQQEPTPLDTRGIGPGTASTSSTNLRLLRNITALNALFPLLILAVKLQFYEDLGDHLLVSFITLIIYATSLLVMSRPDFFRPSAEPAPTSPLPTDEPRRKYEKSSLSEEVEEAVLNRLTRLMETEKPHLANDLSLPRLAGQLNTSPHHLSQLLNDRLGQTFFDLLAHYRVQEARHLLGDPTTAHLKIDEIAERVGYNSPSAFHTAFKRLTGQTPAQFRADVVSGGPSAASSRSARTS